VPPRNAIIHPFALSVTFECEGWKHTASIKLESPAYFDEYFQKFQQTVVQEGYRFLEKILQPAAPPSPQQPIATPPGEAGEKALDN